MARTTTRDRFFTAINEGYEALLSAMEATEARGHKVSQTVLKEVRKGEKELIDLTRQWVDAPTSFFENFGAAVDTQARAQRRALELARDSLSGADEYRREVQEAMSRMARANREAGEALLEAAREAYSRLAERVRGKETEERRPSPDGGGRATRKAAATATGRGARGAEIEEPTP